MSDTEQQHRRAEELASSANQARSSNPEESLALYTEAANIALQLASTDSSNLQALLARHLDNLGNEFIQSNEYSLSRHAYGGAVKLHQTLYDSSPNMDCTNLSKSLHILGSVFNELELYQDSHNAYRDAVRLRRVLYRADPYMYRADLASSLHRLGCSLDKLEHYSKAQEARADAVDLYRVLYASDADGYRARLSDALDGLGSSLDKLKSYSKARYVYREALELLEILHVADPDTYQSARTRVSAYLVSHPSTEDSGQEAKVPQDIPDPSFLPSHSNTSQSDESVDAKGRFPTLDTDYADEGRGSSGRLTIPSSDNSLSGRLKELTEVEWKRNPVDRGSYGLVYSGVWKGSSVALKELHSITPQKLQKRVLREALIWQQQNHQNILPFLGVFTDGDESSKFVYMISPWQKNGNLKHFLGNSEDVNLVDIVFGIACALEYLHCQSPAVVHGDLRAVNILVSDDFIPQLADFGLASLVHNSDHGTAGLLSAVTSTRNRGGAVRWMAPELLADNNGDRPQFTPESDIYSFAMVVVEIFTNEIPFDDVFHDYKVAGLVEQGKRPSRPKDSRLSDAIWECVTQCWAQEPTKRPSASKLVSMLAQLQ